MGLCLATPVSIACPISKSNTFDLSLNSDVDDDTNELQDLLIGSDDDEKKYLLNLDLHVSYYFKPRLRKAGAVA